MNRSWHVLSPEMPKPKGQISDGTNQQQRATLSLMLRSGYHLPAFQGRRLLTWAGILLFLFMGLKQLAFSPISSHAFSSAQLRTTMQQHSSSTAMIQHTLPKETRLSSESSHSSEEMPPCCDDTVDCPFINACCLYLNPQMTFNLPGSSPCFVTSEVHFSSPIRRIPYPPPKI
jgi:hypothetical protein